jgi:glucans biosynthesis protein
MPTSRLPPHAQLLLRLALPFVAALCIANPAVAAFGFEDVAQRARELAFAPYKKPDNAVPKDLQGLNYDQYRDIRFRPDHAWWRTAKLPFELMFFHRGAIFDSRVRINEVSAQGVREIRFDPRSFDYGANKIDPGKLDDLGFAGFRVHYPLNVPRYKDEVLVFLGASYFRALGKDQRYGISARGLAVDTGLPSGEEFPRFTEFWVERPEPSAKELRIYALLDSPRMAGAYRFIVRPGVTTAIDVHVRLYLRENVTALGIAPLSSMYFFGENQRPPNEDFRPEVHDSDGLSIQSGTGEWVWRPFVNPRRLLVTSFAMSNPLGFGVQQRDRAFANYEDLEARYELRPSVWVEPKGKWGSGRVELVQIPTPDETNDNIVAFWVPDTPPPVREPFDIDYRLLWERETETRPPLAWVAQTRRGHGYLRARDDSLQFVVDFEGPALRKLPAQRTVEGIVTLDKNAELLQALVYRNESSNGYRLTIRLKRLDDKKPVEMRAFLRGDNETLSETWSYVLPPT